MSLPTTMKAIKGDGPGKASVHTGLPLPHIPDGYVLVKNTHVGLNPVDWKVIQGNSAPACTIGLDFAGTVVAASPSVTAPSVGDRVAGLIPGGNTKNPESGAFGEYCIAKAGLCITLGASVSDAQAASLGTAMVTIGQALYQTLGLPWPGSQVGDKCKGTILVYGGSGGMGMFAIQFAKLSGWNVVTTCSPHNFDLVKRLGADEVFDYRDAACGSKIRACTNNELMHAFDTTTSAESAAICAEALSNRPGVKYSSLLPWGPQNFKRDDAAVNAVTMGNTASGEEFGRASFTMPAKPEDYVFAKEWLKVCEALVNGDKVVMEPVVRDGGLKKLLEEGFADVREGKISGVKVVYKL